MGRDPRDVYVAEYRELPGARQFPSVSLARRLHAATTLSMLGFIVASFGGFMSETIAIVYLAMQIAAWIAWVICNRIAHRQVCAQLESANFRACIRCAYIIVSESGIVECPECGARFDIKWAQQSWRERYGPT